jgi:hypothetical protein
MDSGNGDVGLECDPPSPPETFHELIHLSTAKTGARIVRKMDVSRPPLQRVWTHVFGPEALSQHGFPAAAAVRCPQCFPQVWTTWERFAGRRPRLHAAVDGVPVGPLYLGVFILREYLRREAHVSAPQPPPQAGPWFPRTDEHQEWAQGARRPPEKGPPPPDGLASNPDRALVRATPSLE